MKGLENSNKDLEYFIGIYGLFGCIGTGTGRLRLGLDYKMQRLKTLRLRGLYGHNIFIITF